VGLGFVGVFLPLVPTTPFLLLALWCFARSSPAVHDWVVNHRLLGPYVRDWQRDGSIPLTAKIAAIVMMTASLMWLALASNAPRVAVLATAAVLLVVAVYIVTRPTTGNR
jgi:uncharacterized membrane protein YbaN (DUF454 family)